MPADNMPRTLFIRTDVPNPEYQEAVKNIFFIIGPDGKPVERGTYYYREDNGMRLNKVGGLAGKLKVEEPWKIFNFESEMCRQFRAENGGRYKSITLDYDLLPEELKRN